MFTYASGSHSHVPFGNYRQLNVQRPIVRLNEYSFQGNCKLGHVCWFLSVVKKKVLTKIKKIKNKNLRLLVEENRPLRHFSTAQNNFRHTCGSGSGLAVTIPRQSSRTQTFMITSLYTTRVMQQKTDPESITGSPSDPDFFSPRQKIRVVCVCWRF